MFFQNLVGNAKEKAQRAKNHPFSDFFGRFLILWSCWICCLIWCSAKQILTDLFLLINDAFPGNWEKHVDFEINLATVVSSNKSKNMLILISTMLISTQQQPVFNDVFFCVKLWWHKCTWALQKNQRNICWREKIQFWSSSRWPLNRFVLWTNESMQGFLAKTPVLMYMPYKPDPQRGTIIIIIIITIIVVVVVTILIVTVTRWPDLHTSPTCEGATQPRRETTSLRFGSNAGLYLNLVSLTVNKYQISNAGFYPQINIKSQTQVQPRNLIL